MSELTYEYEKRETLRALIAPCLVTRTKDTYRDWQPPEPDDFRMVAQWDTGASVTHVTRGVVDVLGLKATGRKVKIHGKNGEYESDTYLVDLYLSEDVVFRNLLVAEMSDTFGSQVLIGLDVILQSNFVIEPQGDDVLLRFRYPSEGNKPFTIDVEDIFKEE